MSLLNSTNAGMQKVYYFFFIYCFKQRLISSTKQHNLVTLVTTESDFQYESQ